LVGGSWSSYGYKKPWLSFASTQAGARASYKKRQKKVREKELSKRARKI
jgi:hypothetical protein